MKGVLLAGGEGKRLHNGVYNKHLAYVYDRLMIEYPLQTLGKMGCDQVLIIGSPQSTPDITRLLGDGSKYGLDLSYKIQREAKGSAHALSLAEGYTNGVFPMLCGDVYFDPTPLTSTEPILIYNEFEGANNHSVWDPETNTITEKPIRDIGRRAIVASYYDDRVYDLIRTLKPTERGEIELVDIHKFYLENGAAIIEHQGFFSDMGTPNGLLKVANHIKENK